jgi:hypothetical protein
MERGCGEELARRGTATSAVAKNRMGGDRLSHFIAKRKGWDLPESAPRQIQQDCESYSNPG